MTEYSVVTLKKSSFFSICFTSSTSMSTPSSVTCSTNLSINSKPLIDLIVGKFSTLGEEAI